MEDSLGLALARSLARSPFVSVGLSSVAVGRQAYLATFRTYVESGAIAREGGGAGGEGEAGRRLELRGITRAMSPLCSLDRCRVDGNLMKAG